MKLKGPQGVVLILDHNDPDTPAIVEITKGRRALTSTYDCAIGEGTVDDEHELSTAQYAWLEQQSDAVAAAYTAARKGLPQYN
jgi:hypothetical protein